MRVVAAALAAALLEEVYSKSTTQLNLPDNLADFLVKWGRNNIPDSDLYYDEDGGSGREDDIHVTVRYGVLDKKPSKALKDIVYKTEPFLVYLESIRLFEQEDHDVVYVAVRSKPLHDLHDAIEAQCNCAENTHGDYKPHVTIAYVKKGRAKKLVGENPFSQSPEVAKWEAQALWFNGAGDTEDPERVQEALAFNGRSESGPFDAVSFPVTPSDTAAKLIGLRKPKATTAVLS